MLSLNAMLSLGARSLAAESGALAVTNNNIANVNTPGYAREVAIFSPNALTSSVQQQDGVLFQGYTSVRNEVLQIGIDHETSQVGSLNSQSASWDQLESQFSGTTSGLGTSLSNFFSSFSALSTSPDNVAVRQSALAATQTLVDAFHQAAGALSSVQAQSDANLTAVVANVNHVTSQIAALDRQLAHAKAAGLDGGSLQDQRDTLATQLAQMVGTTSTSTASTPSLTVGNGTPLVVGGNSYALQVAPDPNGQPAVFDSEGENITETLQAGTLGGMLLMRDGEIPDLTSQLNQLASQFAAAVNAVQTAGFDANGSPGQQLLSVPQGGTKSAASISIALSDPNALALSSDGQGGSTGNLSKLLALQNQQLPFGATPGDAYAALVEQIGDRGSAVKTELSAANTTLTQLQNQQAAESGVSIDEETANLLRYQQAYTAAAKVVTTINDLYTTLMNMGNGA